MVRFLPPHPDLRRIKNEAKSLLKAHGRGLADACDALRRLRCFEGASDTEILSARVSLAQVQFALAMEYGFADWSELRDAVRSCGPMEGYDPSVADGAIVLPDPPGGTTTDNGFVGCLSMVLSYLGSGADPDTVAGDSGVAFIFQADDRQKPFNARVEQIDAGWWPLDPWGVLLRVEFLGRVHGFRLRAIRCDEGSYLQDPAACYGRTFAGPVRASLRAGRPVVAIGMEAFAVFGTDSGRPPLIGRSFRQVEPELRRMERYPHIVIVPEAPNSPMGRPDADTQAIDFAVRLGNDEVELPRLPGKSAGRRSWRLWRRQLSDPGRAGPHFWHANVVRQMKAGRAHAVRYLNAMAARHGQTPARALRRAAGHYNEVLALLGTADTSKAAWEAPDGRSRLLDLLERVQEGEAAALARMDRAAKSM